MKTVVVTGMGMINGVGNNAKESFEAMLNGISGVDYITYFDASNDSVKIASEVKNFDPKLVMEAKDIKKSDRFVHLGMHAVKEAIESGEISDIRYASYLQILEEVEAQNHWERHKKM